MNERFSVVPAAYVILTRLREGRTQVLLQLRRGTGFRDGYWACGAAGHVESGESALAAAVREAREELDVGLAVTDLRPLTTVHRSQHTGSPIDERVDFFFHATTWAGEPRRRETHRSADLDWFPLDDLPTPTVPHEAMVLTALADVLRPGGAPVLPVLTFGFPEDLENP